MSYTDFESMTLDALVALHAVVVNGISELVGGKQATKFVIDGDVVTYTPIELPQLRQLLADVGAAIAVKQAGTSASATAFRITADKGL